MLNRMPHTGTAPQSVALEQLGARLRALREHTELTAAQAAREAGIDPGSLSKAENGAKPLSARALDSLLHRYGVQDASTIDELHGLARVAATARRRGPTWWRRHQAILSPTAFDSYLALEAAASSLRNYEPAIVPGLLQTPAYARAIITGTRPGLSPAQLDELTDIRLARQKKAVDRATHLQALIDEAALARPVHSRNTMHEQLRHLIQTAEHHPVTIRIVPLAAGPHPGLTGPFVIMSFPKPTHDVVWAETLTRSVYMGELVDVEQYTAAFAHLWDREALSPEATRTRLTEMIKEH